MIDKYTKIILTIIAFNLTIMTSVDFLSAMFPDAFASQMNVHIDGGMLDYETDVGGGPTLKVCTDC